MYFKVVLELYDIIIIKFVDDNISVIFSHQGYNSTLYNIYSIQYRIIQKTIFFFYILFEN